MARTRPAHRIADIAKAATDTFIKQGYRRTKMSDVAKAANVSPGTLYLYVQNKDALFKLAATYAYNPEAFQPPETLPLPPPAPGEIGQFVTERITREQGSLTLLTSDFSIAPINVKSELSCIIGQIYDLLSRRRFGIKLADRSAIDHPELAAIWYGLGRYVITGRLEEYLVTRAKQGLLPMPRTPPATARVMLETMVLFAVHVHWDPMPQGLEHEETRSTVVHMLTNAVLRP